ncbi:MAG: choice-of-anchor K domain-containing protein [Synechococcaceae cyanobacterium]
MAAPAHALTLVSAGGDDSLADGAAAWSNPIPGSAPLSTQLDPDLGGSAFDGYRVNWGIGFGGPSGLRWTGTVSNTPVVIGSPIQLATLDHINRPIFGAISGITFNLKLVFDNPAATAIVPIPIVIEETTNTPPCPPFQQSGTACDDRITVPDTINTFVPIPNSTNFLGIDLSFNPAGDNTIISPENSENDGFPVFGTFREVPAPAPFGAMAVLSLTSRKILSLRKRLGVHPEA